MIGFKRWLGTSGRRAAPFSLAERRVSQCGLGNGAFYHKFYPHKYAHGISLHNTVFKRWSSTIGIDFGSSTSVVTVMEVDKPRVAENIEGERVTPSVVAYIDGSPLVGVTAKRQAFLNPKNTFYITKKLIGITQEELPSLKLAYDVTIEDGGGVVITSENGNKIPLHVLLSNLFSRLRETAESTLGFSVKGAVIAVPNYYTDVQKNILSTAIAMSGLEGKFINEDIAATIAYVSIDQDTKNRNIFYYDFGGYSFNVSIIKVRDNTYEVVASDRDLTLGGSQFDQLVFDHLVEEFKKKTNIDLTTDIAAVQKLKDTSERVKMELSTSLTSDIQLPYIAADDSGPKHLEEKLSRAQLERLVLPLLLKTIPICKKVLADARMEPSNITDVLLCGGQSRMPKVQELIKELFGKEPSKSINFDELISIGAALSSTMVLQAPKKSEAQTLFFNPLDLGIELFGGFMHTIIPRGVPIPAQGTAFFSITNDNQKEIEIKVFQGHRKLAVDNLSVGKFNFRNIEKAPKGEPFIKISMVINAMGIITITVENLVNSELIRVQLSSAVKGVEDIRNHIMETDEKATEDEKKLATAKTTLEMHTEIQELMRVVQQFKAIIPENDFVDANRDFERLTVEIENNPHGNNLKAQKELRVKFGRILRNALNKTLESQASMY